MTEVITEYFRFLSPNCVLFLASAISRSALAGSLSTAALAPHAQMRWVVAITALAHVAMGVQRTTLFPSVYLSGPFMCVTFRALNQQEHLRPHGEAISLDIDPFSFSHSHILGPYNNRPLFAYLSGVKK